MNWKPATDFLIESGFRLLGPAALAFEGQLRTRYGAAAVRLVLDTRGIEHPTIWLTVRPTWLPRFSGHVGETGLLCYVDKNTAVPVRSRPREIVQDSLRLATQMLERLVDAGGQVEDEFPVIWSSLELAILVPDGDDTPLKLCDFGDGVDRFDWCVTSESKIPALRAIVEVRREQSITGPIRISIGSLPIAAGPGWPIRNPEDFVAWISYCDPTARDRLSVEMRRVAQECVANSVAPSMLWFLISSPSGLFGLIVDASAGNFWLPSGPQFRRVKPQTLVNMWLRQRGQHDPLRFRARRIDAQSFLARAMGSDRVNLAAKHITLIGAGAVGSYLGEALVKSGAGSNGGTLRIIDRDIVSLENLARSNYQFDEVGKSKSSALKARLSRIWPDIGIDPVQDQAHNVNNLFDTDLLIDATGEVSFSAWLSEERAARSGPPLSTVWIVGNGVAVQSYLQLGDDDLPIMDLDVETPGTQFSPLATAAGMDVQTGPCGEAFTPFSVCAPLAASALALTMVIEHLNGADVLSLRTIILDKTKGRDLPDSKPKRTK